MVAKQSEQKALLGVFCMAVGLFFVIGLVHPRFMSYSLFSVGNAFFYHADVIGYAAGFAMAYSYPIFMSRR